MVTIAADRNRTLHDHHTASTTSFLTTQQHVTLLGSPQVVFFGGPCGVNELEEASCGLEHTDKLCKRSHVSTPNFAFEEVKIV